MKTKNILLGIFSFLALATYAQNEKCETIDTKIAVTEFKVETDNLEELETFDWDMVKEIFQDNDKNQEITLAFAFVNKSEIDKTEVRVDNFELKFTSKTSDLDNLISQLKNSFTKLAEIDGQSKN